MLIDILLGFALLSCALRLVFIRDTFNAILLFILFGIILALVWGRLGAFDVALAEAAIGSGISGALLLDALAHLRHNPKDTP
ncbi:DUF4040 domain-containing protein [Sulfurospirillum sp. T05]|uniref:DUF4040 domain-containing protein n=1 Tax=Sulfurospirillum tamanense TaxID=2813362 RepID=A0ABS2WRN8_9BACT|nr:DUF4040 domain-containing protein [Sulfurospirillum tamanensis]MBN2964265.1 DUF4040 domain-containing protein [Sulfurospirillum tamanensis]